MPSGDYLALMYLGGFFLFLGIFLMIWGYNKKEDDSLGSLSAGSDVRRFLNEQSTKSVPMIFGGLIAFICGLALLAISIIFWL
ncbi:DUF3185 family protein [Chloroflexota bacterium]